MDRLVFTSHSAVNEMAIERQMLVNEMANVSTVGFKRSFDMALRSLKVEGPGFDSRFQTQALSRDVIDLRAGTMMVTGRLMDIGMDGQTVLAVQAEGGQLAFTRRGDLRVNAQGLLENGAGHVVLGEGGPITAPPGFTISISPNGGVYANDPAQPAAPPVLVDQLSLRDASQTSLERRPDGLFAVGGQPPGTDFATGPVPPAVIPNALEGSNVNPIYVMTRLIDHSRTFESQIRAIKEAKALDESGSSLMKIT